MSQTHDIDNDDPFLLLDPYESLTGSRRLKDSVRVPQHPLSDSDDFPPSPSSSTPVLPLDWYYHPLPAHTDMTDEASSSPSKGKGVSQPLYIQGREPTDIQVDTFQILGSSSSAGNISPMLAWPDPSPSVVDPSDVETLQDLIVGALADLAKKRDDLTANTMGPLAGGLGGGIPGFGGPGLGQ